MYLNPGFGGMLIQIVAIVAAGGAILFSLLKKSAQNSQTRYDRY